MKIINSIKENEIGYEEVLLKNILKLREEVLTKDYNIESLEIVDSDLDRIYLKDDKGRELTVRTWNIEFNENSFTDVNYCFRWTLFLNVIDKDGTGHGEEIDSFITYIQLREMPKIMERYNKENEKLALIEECLEDNWNGIGANLRYRLEDREGYLYINRIKICKIDDIVGVDEECDAMIIYRKNGFPIYVCIEWCDRSFISQIYIDYEEEDIDSIIFDYRGM